MNKLLLIIGFLGLTSATLDPLSDEFIDYINSKATTWKAGRNFPKTTSMKFIRGLMGVRRDTDQSLLPVKEYDGYINIADVPESFDARTKWPNCPTINEIRDQSSCGSCWAFGAVESMSDRTCIHSNGKDIVRLSAADLLACCINFGCEGGGFIGEAFKYWKNSGIVTGGDYNSSEGCIPYPFQPCEHRVDGPRPECSTLHYKKPDCVHKCQTSYKTPYDKDLRKAKEVYSIEKDEQKIQHEIMTNGPVETAFDVYEDFLHYKTGVYQHTSGKMLGGHAVRLLGWGVENNTKYWLLANSWNTDWGDKGFFKVLRGENHVGIENSVAGGIPE